MFVFFDSQRSAVTPVTGLRRTAVLSIGVAFAVGLVAFFTPLRVASLGFLPPDDALRHCAKAVSDKPWQDILVLRPDIRMDSHPGWHAILSGARHLTGEENTEALVLFSVVFLFCFFVTVPSFFTKSAELWLLSLLVCGVICPTFAWRLMLGRPFVLTMAVVCAYLFVFTSPSSTLSRKTGMALVFLTALATWAHGLWYLFALLIAAVGLTCGRRQLARIGGVLAAGVAVGSCATGHPLQYLAQTAHHAVLALGSNQASRQLVFEFQPVLPDPLAPLIAAILLVWTRTRGSGVLDRLRTPAFALFVVGWALAFVSGRFWYDWGLPAFAVWMALTAEPLMAARPVMRPAVAFLSAAVLFLTISSDVNSRWTNDLKRSCLDAGNPAHAAWLPDPGGILYSEDMRVFYETFYRNPHGAWRYVLGFEPGWMTPADLQTLRKIQVTESFAAFQPWVDKMTPQDRLVLRHVSTTAPGIPELEWGCPIPDLWIGRKKTKP